MGVKSPCIAVLTSDGISISSGPPHYNQVAEFTAEDDKSSTSMVFSPDGQYLAWCAGRSIKIALCETWKIVTVIEKARRSSQDDSECRIAFSPKSTYIRCCEEPRVHVDAKNPKEQLRIWMVSSGQLLKSFPQCDASQDNAQWTSDESVCVCREKDKTCFFENGNFVSHAQTIEMGPHSSIHISPGNAPYHVLYRSMCCANCDECPGSEPAASVKLFRYPKLGLSEAVINNPIISLPPFLEIDNWIRWNGQGTRVLLFMQTVGTDRIPTMPGCQSVIRREALQFSRCFSTEGKSMKITLGNSAHELSSVTWSPTGDEFCIISKGNGGCNVTVFNVTAKSTFECVKGDSNKVFLDATYNPQGNILNLGRLFPSIPIPIQEMWDIRERKKIADIKMMSFWKGWSPDGEHFLTCFSSDEHFPFAFYEIWHYTGKLLHSKKLGGPHERCQVEWQRFPKHTFPQKPIMYEFDAVAYNKGFTNQGSPTADCQEGVATTSSNLPMRNLTR